MAPAMTYALPAMQLMCYVVMPGTPSFNITTTGPTVHQSPPQFQSAILPDGYIAYPNIGAAYKISNSSVTWKTARERCIAEGAHLAKIDSFFKFEHLMSQPQSTNAPRWVDIHRMYDGTEWVSMSTGSTLTNLPWAPDEPDGDNDCVVASTGPRGLRNFSCKSLQYYACEIPITTNPSAQEDRIVDVLAN